MLNRSSLRKELLKIMPGFKWTVHRKLFPGSNHVVATGIQAAGFNRLSTLEVVWRKKDSGAEYTVRSSGFGLRAPWLSEYTDKTLARALRGLQDHYELMADNYSRHASALQNARKK